MLQKNLFKMVVLFTAGFFILLGFYTLILGTPLSDVPGIVWLMPAVALICEICLFASKVKQAHHKRLEQENQSGAS